MKYYERLLLLPFPTRCQPEYFSRATTERTCPAEGKEIPEMIEFARIVEKFCAATVSTRFG